MTGADFPLCGSAIDDPEEAVDTADRLDIGDDISTGQYNDFVFNSTGRGFIAKSGEAKPTGGTAGITYLGVREGHDILDNAIVGGAGTKSGVDWSSADEAGTTQMLF